MLKLFRGIISAFFSSINRDQAWVRIAILNSVQNSEKKSCQTAHDKSLLPYIVRVTYKRKIWVTWDSLSTLAVPGKKGEAFTRLPPPSVVFSQARKETPKSSLWHRRHVAGPLAPLFFLRTWPVSHASHTHTAFKKSAKNRAQSCPNCPPEGHVNSKRFSLTPEKKSRNSSN